MISLALMMLSILFTSSALRIQSTPEYKSSSASIDDLSDPEIDELIDGDGVFLNHVKVSDVRRDELLKYYGLPRASKLNMPLSQVTGEGQTVAIIDLGLTEELMKEFRHKVIKQINFHPKGLEISGKKEASHSYRSVFYGYWNGEDGSPETFGSKAQVVVLRFAPSLYVREHELRNDTFMKDWIEGIASSLEWVEKNSADLNITTVQLSALDGLPFDAPSFWITKFSELYQRVSASLSHLNQQGIWISAPAGNSLPSGVKDDFSKIFWPASDPQVTAIGCSCGGKPTLHRSKKVDLAMPVDGCATSRCNIYACGLSMLVREAIVKQCGIKNVNASSILAVMQHKAKLVEDSEVQGKLLIANPFEMFDNICATLA